MVRWLASLLMMATPAAAQIAGARTLGIQPSDAVYLRQTNRVLASILSTSPQLPNTLVEVDPRQPAVLRSIALPTEATLLVLSRDESTLYAITRATPSIVYRINTSAMTIEATLTPLLSDADPANQRICSLVELVGQPTSFAAAFTDQWGNWRGAAVFDEERRRPKIVLNQYAAALYQTDDPELLYGYDALTTAFLVYRLRVGDDGLEVIGDAIASPESGFGRQLRVYRGLLYGANGTVFDVENRRSAGAFRSLEVTIASAFTIDEDAGLIYFAARSGFFISYFALDMRTFTPVARLRVGSGDFGARRLLLTNDGDIVTFDGERSDLLFFPTSSLPRYQPWTGPGPLQTLAPNVRGLAVPAAYLSADPVRGKLLASLPGAVPGAGNSVLTIDPEAGRVESQIFVGAEPGPPVVSARGKYVYAPLYHQSSVRRILVSESRSDLLIPVVRRRLYAGAPVQPAQVVPLPDSEESFSVIQGVRAETNTPEFDAIVVYDGVVPRPKVVTQTRVNSAAVSNDGRRLVGLEWETSGFGLSLMSLQPDGVVLDRVAGGIGTNFFETLHCDDTLCATTMGTVFDGQSGRRTARLAMPGVVFADRENGRIYVLTNDDQRRTRFYEYDAESARVLRSAVIPISPPYFDLCRWKPGEFAALTHAGIVLISAAVLNPVAPVAVPAPQVTGGVAKLGLLAASLAYDSRRNLLYAAIPGRAEAYPNEIVAIDPKSGSIVKSIVAGSDPSLLRITSDGRFLYCGLQTGNAVVRVDLENWTRQTAVPVPGSPYALLPRPNDPDSFILGVGEGPRIGRGGSSAGGPMGLTYYRNNQPMPLSTPNVAGWLLNFDANTLLSSDGRIRVGTDGLTAERYSEPFVGGRGVSLARGLVFSDNGSIGDASNLRFRDRLDENGTVLPEPDISRIYYLRREGIRVYDWETLRIIGKLPYDFGDTGSSELVSMGTDRMALLGRGTVYLIDTAAIRWNVEPEEKPVERANGLIRTPLEATALLYDTKRNVLYAATPAIEGALGQGVVVVDAATAAVLQHISVGTAPTSLALSGDMSRLYVGLRGTRSIAVIDLETRRVVQRIATPRVDPFDEFWPEGIAVMPGTNDVLGVTTFKGGGARSDWRQMILNPNGTPRPQMVGLAAFRWAPGRLIAFNSDGTRLHGFDDSSAGARWSLPVGPSGLEYNEPIIGSVERNIAVCGDVLLTASGQVYELATLAPAGELDFGDGESGSRRYGLVACDPGRDRAYYLRRPTVTINGRVVFKLLLDTFEISTRRRLEPRELPDRGAPPTQIVALPNGGLAYLSGGQRDLSPFVTPSPAGELAIIQP